MKKTSFTENWRFGKADEPLQPVILPHDAMLHRNREPQAPGGSAQAYFPGGRYIYEKTFSAPDAEHVLFQFEGVYKNTHVYLNGKEAGGCAYGYLPFFVCADGLLTEGENTIRVECDNQDQPDSRWYSGAGIYRPVWLWTGPKASIEPEAVRIRTLSTDPARIHVTVQVPPDAADQVAVEILYQNKIVASGTGKEIELTIPDARLWSEDTPELYTCRVRLGTEETVTTFGIRTVHRDNKGLYINGRSVLLRGGCLHHDNGILGAATWDESEYRRAKKLKEAGFNAIRSAHNPVSRAMLEACDRLGLYVMDESWDMWYQHKSRYDYAGQWREHYREDLRAMVDRDFNHPSVILYSIGNEVSEPAKPEGIEKTREMTEYLHHLDPDRLVTGGFNLMIISSAKKGKGIYKEEGGRDESGDNKMSGMNSTMFNLLTSMIGTGMNKAANSKAADEATSPSLDILDIAGYNYASGRYPSEGKKHPDRLILGSETFPQDIAKNWAAVKRYPYLVGDFMWTCWDYLGEAGIGAWSYTPDGKGFNKPYPWLLADTGAFDILGHPNGELFLAQAAWEQLSAPAIAVQPVNHPGVKPARMAWRGTNALPSWSWQDCEGNQAVVEVYSSAAAVELFLNDRSLGRKKVKNCKATFRTRYAAGTLRAAAMDAAGAVVGKSTLSSATGSIGITVTPEVKTARPGELIYVEISMTGENGVVEANADAALTVSVEGGRLLGFGSANPRTEERFDRGTYTTYYGRSLAAVLADKGDVLRITATDGSRTASASIDICGQED